MRRRPGSSGWMTAALWGAAAAVAVGGVCLFREKYAAWLSLCVAVLACLPLFFRFERRENTPRELAVVAVMTALCAAGRFLFAWLPGFKPVTALTVITGVWLGPEAGFAVGALSAVLSNVYFGQGPWTPFQMAAWGLLGFLAGVLARPLKKSRVALCFYGAAAGVLYSAAMDVWTALWADGRFVFARYAAAVLSALPVTAEYALSNVVFLLLLARPIGGQLQRIQIKYGLFVSKTKSVESEDTLLP